jgi:hypothetical protein
MKDHSVFEVKMFSASQAVEENIIMILAILATIGDVISASFPRINATLVRTRYLLVRSHV